MGLTFSVLKRQVSESDEPIRVTIRDAARMMGTTPRYLQAGLQEGKFPFGAAIMYSRWSYYINAQRFVLWMEGKDLKEGDHAASQK